MSAQLQETSPEVANEDQVMIVPPEFVPYEWPVVMPLLQPAVDRSGGRWSMRALLAILCTGEHQLWVIKRSGVVLAAATTQVVSYPHKRMLAVHFLGGSDYEDWKVTLLSSFEQYASDAGCGGVEATARFGFWPLFKGRGYERSYCLYDLMFEDR